MPAAKKALVANDFQKVFAGLRALLAKHAPPLRVAKDQPGNYWLETISHSWRGQPMFFGAVQIKKNYVSYHLLPLHGGPQLLDGISPGLKKRMQGKSCFNFISVDDALFAELDGLTSRGLGAYQTKGYL